MSAGVLYTMMKEYHFFVISIELITYILTGDTIEILNQWVRKPLFIPCILFVCVITGIVGTLFLTMPVIKL